MKRSGVAALLTIVGLTLLLTPTLSGAAEPKWSEINTGHFAVWSSADDGSARTLAWQFEQIRSAVKAMWPWAQVDLTKPMLIFVVKDEAAMKTMAPEYWERRGAGHPASVWVSGRDRHYMVIRADVRGQDTDVLNPYTSAYYGYTNLVLEESFDHELPLWFSRGLSGVLSNTIVHETTLKVGAPIPWHLAALRSERRFHLVRLLKVDRKSPEYLQGGQLETFDAQAWAFVHMLMFANDGAYRPKLDTFMRMMRAGKEPEAAFAETFGDPAQYETPFVTYITRAIYSYAQGETDNAVKKEKFALRPLGVAESAAGRAAFQVAMGRQAEARTLIAAGRQADPNEPGTYVAEGLLFDRAGDADQAQAAFARAVALDSKDFYAHYRLGSLLWRGPVSSTALRDIESHYSHAIGLNTRSAEAYSAIAEARAALGRPEEDTVPFALRAVSLEPAAAYHHVVAAKVYLRANRPDDAERELRKAQALPDVDRVQGLVDTLVADIARARATSASSPSGASSLVVRGAPAASGADAPAAPAGSGGAGRASGAALPESEIARGLKDCEASVASACAAVLPPIEKACTERKDGSACGMAAWIRHSGLGVPVDVAGAAALYQESCDFGEPRGCLAIAALQMAGSGVARDEAKAMAAFERLCGTGLTDACTAFAAGLASKPGNAARAREIATKACSAGDPKACELVKRVEGRQP